MAAGFERPAQLPEIIYLAVEDDGDVAALVEDGLAASGKINDAEAAHPDGGARHGKQPIFVRAAMAQRRHHAPRDSFRLRATFHSDDAADSTHRAIWSG